MSKAILLVVLFVGGWLMAQENSDQSSKEKSGQLTVQGCVSRSSGDYILMQSNPGNSYVLHAADNIKMGRYLGQQVKVTGTESPTMSNTSGRAATSETIMVNSIKTISKHCTH
jgi:hypothetical protein